MNANRMNSDLIESWRGKIESICKFPFDRKQQQHERDETSEISVNDMNISLESNTALFWKKIKKLVRKLEKFS